MTPCSPRPGSAICKRPSCRTGRRPCGGPVSNGAGPPQQVAASYRDGNDLCALPPSAPRSCIGGTRDVQHLTSFCLLLHRGAVERLGDLDRTLASACSTTTITVCGCARPASACGWCPRSGSTITGVAPLRVWASMSPPSCTRVGSTSGPSGGQKRPSTTSRQPIPSCGRLRHRTWWRRSHHKSSRRCAATAAHPPGGHRPQRGGQSACLGPLRSLVDELLVVDTGSTDRTRAVAEELGTVVTAPWQDSFAASAQCHPGAGPG